MWAFFALTPINIYMIETLEKISRTVSDFGNHSQFESWLLEVGKKAGSDLGPRNTRSICNDNNYVRGCTSNVWITGKQDMFQLTNNKQPFEICTPTILVPISL